MHHSASTDPKWLNYIPTSCSQVKFLFLVTFLNLDVIFGRFHLGGGGGNLPP